VRAFGWKCVLAAAAICVFTAHPGDAASPRVEAAIKALAKIESDPAKFQAFCALIKELRAAHDDAVKSEALDKQMDQLLRSIGPDVFLAWDLAGEIDPQTEDGAALEAAVDTLEGKCGE
jgi:hypothetical protein